MQVLIHQKMNIISAVVLLLFMIYSYNVFDKKQKINRLYLVSLTLNTLLIILELITAFLAESYSVPLRILSSINKVLIVAIAPYLSFVFFKLICNYFPKPFKIRNCTTYLIRILIAFNAIAAVIYFFSLKAIPNLRITEYSISLLLSFIFTAYSVFIILKNKNMIIQFEFAAILTTAITASLLILIQLMVNATSFIWCSNSIILIFMFVIIQQRELYRDSLTGARNRVVLKKCIDAYKKKPNGNLAAVMIDLDYFKSINDSYGHSEGDYALKSFVRILQIAYSDHGVVIRMGGDEFLVLIRDVSFIGVNEMIKKMSKMIDSFNNKSDKPYHLRYSYASGMYNDKNISIEQFIHDLDMKMYQNKKGNRERIWSIKNM
ncbi:GGDEF domain-containing protein [Ruminiclostridium herbifermentans]|uniref:GGDEF domain-containing protein n=1 Tax=Ruminiclostridium herbifermentans TaxID=2488810 RepID=A0A4U7JEN0_9FIRM|nr:GGDEF domain-containing protein [Ruminiclostridium herbifermentans]QNU67734.1 GGDEF domain-containing protein [Ruminiclostridium herbifermentans]